MVKLLEKLIELVNEREKINKCALTSEVIDGKLLFL